MLIQTRIPYPQEMSIVWLPLNGVARQGLFSIFQPQQILEDVDLRLFFKNGKLS